MLKIGTRKEIQDYQDNPALNQSLLKQLNYSPQHFLEAQSNPYKSDSLLLGSLVDCMLLSENTTDAQEQYCTLPEKGMPPEGIKNVIDDVFQEIITKKSAWDEFLPLEQYPELIMSVVERRNYQPNYKDGTKLAKILENAYYYCFLIQNHGKTLVTEEMFQTAANVVSSITSSPLGKYFNREKIEANDNLTVYYQKPLFFEYEGVICKALPDIIWIEKMDETHYNCNIIDLKTTSLTTLKFPEAFVKYKYDTQLMWYLLAVEDNIIDLIGNVTMSYQYSIIAESTTIIGSPVLYRIPWHILRNALKSDNKNRKSIETLITDYKYYQEKGYKTERIIAENIHELTLYIEND